MATVTSDPLVQAVAGLIARHHTGTNQPVQPAPWMTAAAQEIADAIADGCRRNISVNNIYPRCVCAEINDALNRRKA